MIILKQKKCDVINDEESKTVGRITKEQDPASC